VIASEADGSQPQQIDNKFAEFETCGNYLIYARRVLHEDDARLLRVDADGKNATEIGDEPPISSPSCSQTGQTVYYLRKKGALYRAPAQGGPGQKVAIEQDEGTLRAIVSPDEKMMATVVTYYREGVSAQKPVQLRILPLAEGAAVGQFDVPPGADPTGSWGLVDRNWTPDSKAVAYIDTRDGVGNIWLQPIAGGPAKQLTHFTSERMMSFDFSRDGKIAFSRGHFSSDAVRITNLK
jgi:hypothetical protein